MTPERFDVLQGLSCDAYVGGAKLGEACNEIARLADLVYVPGAWYCSKCGFELVCSILFVASGGIAASRRDPRPCPNDGEKLLPGTWKRDAERMAERMIDANCMAKINGLHDQEASSVTIDSDNADFNSLPNCCIEVVGEWTNWMVREFRADTLIQALAAAESARGAWLQSHKG